MAAMHELITLRRDCEAVQIPNGTPLTLPAGTPVRITQSLGGTYTVTTEHGHMVRIAGHDADALGLEPTAVASTARSSPRSAEEVERLVWEELRSCFDPEIPVNIVELGLVYHCRVAALPEGGYRAEVKFTLTAPGCGMGDVIKADLESKLQRLPGVRQVDIEVVFEPPWNPGMMSAAARLELGMV